MTNTPVDSTDRKVGRITRILGDYGFVSADDSPDQDLYFKMSWFRGSPPLIEGEMVAFELKTYSSNLQAHGISRQSESTLRESTARRQNRVPTGGHLFD